jgi:hypothetical protein
VVCGDTGADICGGVSVSKAAVIIKFGSRLFGGLTARKKICFFVCLFKQVP